MDVREELFELRLRNRREREADEARQDDRPGRVLLDQVLAHRLGVDVARLHAHEVAGVERHDRERLLVFGMRLEDAADLVVARAQHLVLLLLLRVIVRIRIRGDREVLADRRDVGDRRADIPRRLGLQRPELRVRRALEREGDKADAQPPHVVLLRRAVELDGDDVRMQRRELREQRLLMDARLVDEPEIGVVEDDDDPPAGLRGGLDGGDDPLRVLERRGVARRVVREVEDEELLHARRGQRGLQRRRVKMPVLERVEVAHLAADGIPEDQLVVVPEEVGRDELVARVEKQLRRDPKAVRERVRDDGVRAADALHGRVLLQLHRAPLLAEGRKAEASGVEERLAAERHVLREAVHHERRAVLLERHADRRVDVAALGFAALAENAAVGEVEAAAGGGERVGDGAEILVELLCELVHRESLLVC